MARGRSLVLVALAAVAGLGPAAAARSAAASPAMPWMDRSKTADERAHLLLPVLTLDEKVTLMHGIGSETGTGFVGAHTGALPPIARVGFPGMYFTDGPLGVHGPGLLASELPSGVSLAATFDPDAARAYGAVIGYEARAKNDDVVFGPMVNMVRTYKAGRNFETYGEDPFLAARLAVADVQGIQSQGVVATTKHWVAYNQETESNTTVPGTAVDAVVDERTLHELYMPAFEAAVSEGHTGSVMSAYNKVNGAYNAENCPLLRDTLKGMFGFPGFVVSDYDSTHGSAVDVTCGNDVEQPDGTNYDHLPADVASGAVTMAAIDDAVLRVLRTAFQFGVFDRAKCPQVDSCYPIDRRPGTAVSRRVAEESTVLLKNLPVGPAPMLPVDTSRVHSIALVGPNADRVAKGHGSSEVNPLYEVTPLQGISARAGAGITVLHASTEAGQLVDAATADMALVFVGDSATEGGDRPCLALACPGYLDVQPEADALVAATLAANPHTVVVLGSGAPDLLPWEPLAPAIVQGWYPGEEDGNAIAAILFGDVNPSGRMPVSFPKLETDQPALSPQQYPGVANEAQYSEGMYTGYRHFDRHGIDPLYAFGFGLSYTTFAYSNLRLTPGHVGFDVTNTGRVAGTDVPQLYMGPPAGSPVDEPARQLEGFTRMTLGAGQTGHAEIAVAPRAVSYYNVASHSWTPLAGCHVVMIGSSERDIRLQASGLDQSLQPCAAAGPTTAAPPAVPAALPLTGTAPPRGLVAAGLVFLLTLAAATAWRPGMSRRHG